MRKNWGRKSRDTTPFMKMYCRWRHPCQAGSQRREPSRWCPVGMSTLFFFCERTFVFFCPLEKKCILFRFRFWIQRKAKIHLLFINTKIFLFLNVLFSFLSVFNIFKCFFSIQYPKNLIYMLYSRRNTFDIEEKCTISNHFYSKKMFF